MPAELDELTRRVMRLEIEEAALAKENDPASLARLEELRRELADLRAEADAKRAQWEAERQAIRRVQELRGELEQVRQRGRGGRARLRPQPGRRAAIRRAWPSWNGGCRPRRSSWPASRASAGCCARWSPRTRSPRSCRVWTGIPVTRLQEGEREKLLRLDEILHERVVGQDEAVQAVADAIIRARSGIKDPRRPIGSFIFLGPTGVGKTELAKTLADALFDSEDKRWSAST